MSGLLLGALLLGLPAESRAAPGPATIKEVHQKGKITSILIELGQKQKVTRGQSLEIRRSGRTVGYGSVDKVFSRVAVATVGTIVGGAGPLVPGDKVRFIGSGFKKSTPRPTPVRKKPAPRGKVVSVRGGIVVVDFGREQGLRSGNVVALRDPASNKEVGRIAIELAGPRSGGGLLISGKARPGLLAVVTKRRRIRSIDFVKLDFLGAVADLEHPTPHRSPCHLGVPVLKVLPASPAQRAGIGKGDRLLSVDGTVVRTIAGVRERIKERATDRVRVMVVRGDRVLQVDVQFTR